MAVTIGSNHTAFAKSSACLTFAVSDYYAGTTPHGEFLAFITAVLAREHMTVEITPLPVERALILSNSGEIDGELSIGTLNDKDYPNVVQSTFPILVVKYSVIQRSGESLSRKSISALRGVIPLNLRGMEAFISNQKLNISGIRRAAAALDMVANKRADYTIGSDIVFQFGQYKEHPSLVLSKDFTYTLPIYLRLNKKHKDLLKSIESAFQKEKFENAEKYPILKKYFGF
ncbi:hypothetical protein ACES2I_13710 [Bdellovibrio bacteriovorus]|uniref:hypothetical protein n=1 Tax=Bdellovibrio bacteriovorus TaxID=959 RepID=UPI0035A6FD8E